MKKDIIKIVVILGVYLCFIAGAYSLRCDGAKMTVTCYRNNPPEAHACYFTLDGRRNLTMEYGTRIFTIGLDVPEISEICNVKLTRKEEKELVSLVKTAINQESEPKDHTAQLPYMAEIRFRGEGGVYILNRKDSALMDVMYFLEEIARREGFRQAE